jgi:nitrate reductase gamma subunit
MNARFHRFLLILDRKFAELVVVLGLAVEYLATTPGWAVYLGKWGGLATVAIGFAALLLRRARNKAQP